METSLLARLYPYFKGSQEDVATTSLQYIVSSNEILNSAFTMFVFEKLQIDDNGKYQYKCQVSGNSKEKERPDMSAFDCFGNEALLVESKFYAALTANQPNAYLKRLIDEKGKGLLFICPGVRIKGLWSEITTFAKNQFELITISDTCVEVNGVRMSITTWNDVLSRLSDVALNNTIDQMDIKQLQGYCNQLDSEAFIPFDELDFGIENAIKMDRHTRLIDEVVAILEADVDLKISTKNLKATPQKNGYTRYFRMKNYGISLEIDTRKWKNPNSYITPYWIKFSKLTNEKWVVDDTCEKALMSISDEFRDGYYLALIAPCYVTLDDVTKAIKSQIKDYLEKFETAE